MLATRQASDARQPGRPFPAIELASLHAVKQVLLGSDAIAPLTLPCVADELERGTLVVLATESWVYTQYGLVRLKGHKQSAAASRFADCLREEEAALVRDESRLVAAHWTGRKPPAARRKRGA
jgi:DNA-binding transcriptional LysR family regulator